MAKSELEGAVLSEVAQMLLPTGRGRPRPAQLRRAISTAYYACFHALTSEIASHYGSEEAQLAARRLIAHASARGVCAELARRQVVPWMTGEPPCHADLLQFAVSFENLYLARGRADYDHRYRCSKRDAVEAVQEAQTALGSLESAASSCPEQLDLVAVAILADDRRRKLLRAG